MHCRGFENNFSSKGVCIFSILQQSNQRQKNQSNTDENFRTKFFASLSCCFPNKY